jgi:hypothetical protein
MYDIYLLSSRREATALEEAFRSWVKNPSRLDVLFNRELLKKYQDPDDDEEVVKGVYEARRLKKKEMVAAAAASKKK